MYNLSNDLSERLNNRIQTKANNNEPRPVVYLVRPTTQIQSQKFWEKTIITSDVGTRSSIAIRRPKDSLVGNMVFVAQVVAGTAVIKAAAPLSNLKLMKWTIVKTIHNVSELSILFDGYMEKTELNVESYTIGTLPYVIYVDTSGSLKVINLDDPDMELSISTNAVNVASVRGLYSADANLDDGILVFYTDSQNRLWESAIINGAISYVTQITNKPEGVTGWLDCWAERTFDFRITLQLKGDDGKVHILMSTSRTSGFSTLEYLKVSNISVKGQWGSQPPNLTIVDSVGV